MKIRSSVKRAQRKDLLRGLDIALFAAFLQIWYIDRATIQFFVRCISQIQHSNPHLVHPDRPLSFFVAFLVLINSSFLLTHLFTPGPIGGHRRDHAGLFLDFIGQETVPPKIVLLLIDSFILLLQLIFLIIAYDESAYALSTNNDGDDGEESGSEDDFDGEGGGREEDRILTLNWKTTLRRILHARTTSSETEQSGLTARGNRVRDRRRREGLDEDALGNEEELNIGLMRRGEG